MNKQQRQQRVEPAAPAAEALKEERGTPTFPGLDCTR